VIVRVKKSDREGDRTNNHTVHFTSRVGIGDDHQDEYDLGESDLGHDKTFLDCLDNLTGSGNVHLVSLAVTGHFYYVLRK